MQKMSAKLTFPIPAILWLRKIVKLVLLMMIGVSMSACGSGTEKWKEEVLLHDGSKIVVERSQTFGGRHEFGQSPPIREHSVTFTPVGANKPITWKSEFSEDIGHSNFKLLVLDVVGGTAYVVAYPTGNLAYNKWGRPNPPYVFFKYADAQWKQITLVELPIDIKQPNVVIDTYGHADVDQSVKSGFITADKVKQLNSTLTQNELRNIVRTPVIPKTGSSLVNSEKLVHYKCGWTGVNSDGTFNKEFMDRMCK